MKTNTNKPEEEELLNGYSHYGVSHLRYAFNLIKEVSKNASKE